MASPFTLLRNALTASRLLWGEYRAVPDALQDGDLRPALLDDHGKLVIAGNFSASVDTTGLATDALQIAGNASLTSIDAKIPASPATDRATAAAPFAARLSDGAAFYAAPAAAQLPSSLGIKTAALSLSTTVASDDALLARTPALGQAAMVGSTPVVIASDQSVIKIQGGAADGALIAGAGNPVFIGGTDGANFRAINVDSNGAVRLQSGGTAGQAVPTRVTQSGGPDGGGLLRAARMSAAGFAVQVAAVGTGYRSTALEASAVASASPVTLVRFGMANNAATTRYVQVHDANALPANGAIPEDGGGGQSQNSRSNITCPPTNTLSVGCVLACSTTMATLTVTGTGDALFVADFHPSTA